MRMKLLAAAIMAASCSTCPAAMAQGMSQAETSPPAAPEQTPPTASVSVPKGTPIVVEITDLVSTRTAKQDDMFNLKLAEPISLNGIVLIPAGTPCKGQVIDAGKPGMGGKPGKLVLAARYLDFEDRQIPIRGLNLDMEAKDNSGASMAAAIVVGLPALIVTGGHMEVQPGTRARAKLGVDFTPAVTDAAPSPAPASDVAAPSSTSPTIEPPSPAQSHP